MTRHRVEPSGAPTEPEAGIGEIHYSNLHAVLDDLENSNGTRDWIVEGVIEDDPIIVFTGPEKRWKSWIGVDLAVAMATGGKWLGEFQVTEPGDVIVVDVEYGKNEWTRRMKRVCAARGVDPRRVLDRIRYFDGRYGFMLSAAQSPEYVQLVNDVKHAPPALIIIDPLRNVLDGDENSAKDIIAAMKLANTLRCLGGCPVFIAHHLNRSGKMAGSRAIRSRADLLFDGSDKPQPWYTATGRTIRSSDPIAKPFTVKVEHENDGNDSIAKTLLRVEWSKGEESPDQKDREEKVIAALKGAGSKGLIITRIRNAAKLSSTNAKATLEKLRKEKRVRKGKNEDEKEAYFYLDDWEDLAPSDEE